MGNPSKTLTAISSCVKPFTFNRGAGSLELLIDLDAFTDQFFIAVGERHKDRVRAQLPSLDKTVVEPSPPPQEVANVDIIESIEPDPVGEPEQTPESKIEAVAKARQSALESALKQIEDIWKGAAQNVNDQRDLRIDMLLDGEEEPKAGAVLRGWDAEQDDGSRLPLTASILRQLSNRATEELWEFCAEQVRTVKKTPTAAGTR